MEAALIGLQQKQTEVEARIAELKRRLGHQPAEAPPAPVRKRRRLSAAARKRIADATKKRWAEFRAKKAAAAAAKAAPRKRRAKKAAAAPKPKAAES
jgi:hypothetical protein